MRLSRGGNEDGQVGRVLWDRNVRQPSKCSCRVPGLLWIWTEIPPSRDFALREGELTLTDQSSILRFIENNWDLGRIGKGSYDEVAGRLTNMFTFERKRRESVFLDTTTGLVIAVENQ
jgi:hypothetical protein